MFGSATVVLNVIKAASLGNVSAGFLPDGRLTISLAISVKSTENETRSLCTHGSFSCFTVIASSEGFRTVLPLFFPVAFQETGPGMSVRYQC